MSGSRRGFTKVPNSIWDDKNLDGNDKILLLYFAGHQRGFKVNRDHTLKQLGWGEQKYDKVRKRLVKLGYLKLRNVRVKGKIDHQHAFVTWSPGNNVLNPDFKGAEEASEPRFSAPCFSGELRRTTKRRFSENEEVINFDDVQAFVARDGTNG